MLHPQAYNILFDGTKLDIYVVIPLSPFQLNENKISYQIRFQNFRKFKIRRML
jgi:hypothetical protein